MAGGASAGVMKQYRLRRDSRHARWAWRLAFFSLVLFVTAGLGHRQGFVDTIAFIWLLGLIGVFALLALGLSWAAFSRLWQVDEAGMGRAFAAAILALVVLAPFAVSGVRVFTHPPLSDISTDIARPPSLDFAARMRQAPMNPVEPITPENAALQRQYYPGVTGRYYDQPATHVHEVVLAMVRERGWRVLRQPDVRLEGDNLTVEAEARTLLLGFPVDVSVRVRRDGPSSYVDMRSSSRYGEHDLGDNARRIVAFLDDLDDEVALNIVPMPED